MLVQLKYQRIFFTSTCTSIIMDCPNHDRLLELIGRREEEYQVAHDGIRKLLAAMIVRGLRDLSSTIPEERKDAVKWLFSSEKRWVFSYWYCCHALCIDQQALRDFILHNYPWTREVTGLTPRCDALKFKCPDGLNSKHPDKDGH